MTNGIQFKRLVLKNFLSFGSTPTEIDLTGDRITVVLGLNHDTGGDESRNGVGKSAIIDAISYVLFGKTIRGISNQKLVNKMARQGQGMLVTLELDTPSGSYRIERGESPGRIKLFHKELDDENEFLLRDGKKFVYDVTRSKAETTEEIENLIGFDIKLFEFLIANTSESIPFMKLPEDKKREIAERLMGLNLLTERAEELKEERKEKKKQMISAESSIEATKQANKRIEQQLADLERKEADWEKKRQESMEEIREQIEAFREVDVTEQIEILELIDQLEEEEKRIRAYKKQTGLELREANRNLRDLQKQIDSSAERFQHLGETKKKIEDSECPTCGQHWEADKSVIEEIDKEIGEISDFSEESVGLLTEAESEVAKIEERIKELEAEEEELNETATEAAEFDLLFESIQEASEASSLVENGTTRLKSLEEEENPHSSTIKGLREEALQDVDDTELRNLRNLIEHYNYLIDLLQSKDSFLRRAVIDRWLPKLNGRIGHYLETLELPFSVHIENDLTMSIIDFGEEFDWGNLSKGQRQRVTIALNLAFQDLFEATNKPLSLLMIDELIDSGICNRGASQAVEALKDASQNKDKRVFLITHRTDIADQIEDTMLVEMKNKVSRIDDELTEDF